MAGRQKDRKKDFRNDPFKSLKGFCVLPTQTKPVEEPSEPPAEGSTAGDDGALFAEEMDRLGVARRNDSTAEQGEMPSELATPDAGDKVGGEPAGDHELFLAALGEMEAVFSDGLPEEEQELPAPRRMRLLRRGKIVPEGQLDLHGLTRDEARVRVGHFIDNALHQGLKAVLIVTGRGKGSGGEPVLRGEIERFLIQETGGRVAEWGRAPARYGGEGALVVFLKGRQGSK